MPAGAKSVFRPRKESGAKLDGAPPREPQRPPVCDTGTTLGANDDAAALWLDAPGIEAARPGYPCLIDAGHHVAALYKLVNVPQAVWIGEAVTRLPLHPPAASTAVSGAGPLRCTNLSDLRTEPCAAPRRTGCPP